MTRRTTQTAMVLALSLLGAATHAQDAVTREQVRSELLEAIHSGDIVSGEGGPTLREQFPGRYPPVARPAGATRSQVQQELKDAMQSGEVPAAGEIAQLPRSGPAGSFPRELAVGGKTRQEVTAELMEAIRTGNILAGGESGQTLAELHPGSYGATGRGHMMASGRAPVREVR